MIRLIGICGVGPKSGKSEVAHLLYLKSFKREYFEEHDYKLVTPWQIKKFASGPKEIVAKLTEVPCSMLDKQSTKDTIAAGWENNQKIPRTYRDLIINVAEGLRERICQDIWVKYLFNKFSDKSHWIIDDVRFIPEAKKIIEKGGIIVKVRRDEAEKGEIELPDKYVKYEIHNNGTLEDLKNQVEELLKMEGLL